MTTTWRSELPLLTLLAGMFLLAAVSWPTAPDRIPVHWNASGEIDRYGGKGEGLLALPLVAAGIYLLMLFLPRVDPGRANYATFQGVYNVLRFVALAGLAVIYGIVHLHIRGHAVDVSRLVPLVVGVIFVLVGGLLGKVRPNWFVGIRTPWTLSSKMAWTRTHRLGGWLFMVTGLASLATGVALPGLAHNVILAGGVGSALVCAVYSYLVWRKDPDRVPPAGSLPAEEPKA